jgi:hypothetical protein
MGEKNRRTGSEGEMTLLFWLSFALFLIVLCVAMSKM